jgi:uroporphyrinogen-III synthase
MRLGSLEGFVVGVTADRRAPEQAALLERRGASIVFAPTIATHYLESDETLRAVTAEIIERKPDYLVANTGIGMRVWFESAQSWGLAEGLTDALAATKIVARGPKAANVARAHGLQVWAQASSERLDELLALLCAEPLAGRDVVIQEHGSPTPAFVAGLTAAGAHLIEVPIYRWRLPDDPLPAQRLIEAACQKRIDAVTFTSAPAVHNLFVIAAQQHADGALRRAFNRGVVAACVGSVCADGARQEGIQAPLAPTTGRLGLLVRALSDHFHHIRTTLHLNGIDVSLQGSLLAIGDTKIQLTPRERGVLQALAAQPGAVLSRATLLQTVWGSPSNDPHALEMTITRLRTKLGPCRQALRTVPRRGYRLEPD